MSSELCDLIVRVLESKRVFDECMGAVKGIGTNDTQLIRSIVTRMDIDMKMIKRYYKKLFGNNMADDIKGDTGGNYQKLLLYLIGEK